MEEIKGLDKFAKNYAIYRNFMQFVKDKYPKIHKEYWDNIAQKEELIRKIFPKANEVKPNSPSSEDVGIRGGDLL